MLRPVEAELVPRDVQLSHDGGLGQELPELPPACRTDRALLQPELLEVPVLRQRFHEDFCPPAPDVVPVHPERAELPVSSPEVARSLDEELPQSQSRQPREAVVGDIEAGDAPRLHQRLRKPLHVPVIEAVPRQVESLDLRVAGQRHQQEAKQPLRGDAHAEVERRCRARRGSQHRVETPLEEDHLQLNLLGCADSMRGEEAPPDLRPGLGGMSHPPVVHPPGQHLVATVALPPWQDLLPEPGDAAVDPFFHVAIPKRRPNPLLVALLPLPSAVPQAAATGLSGAAAFRRQVWPREPVHI
mmetsp:Transcript_30009/g.71510  ORF Transcript_30009/g.71510 Transcript_30009/m.71510 type:complete len:300 (-) Transcript_30009:126-1025(-)